MNLLVKILKLYKQLGVEYVKKIKIVNNKNETLEDIKNESIVCKKCNLHKSRTNVVFGEGSANASLMFVGEAPGRDEDLSARPFVGRAGKLLRGLIEEVSININDVYIANCIKCKPPDNRDPNENEIKSCSPYLLKQVEIIQPKLIVTLGRYAAWFFTNTSEPMRHLRGKIFRFKNIKVICLYHPAYLLRNPRAIDIFISDLKIVKGILSEKVNN